MSEHQAHLADRFHTDIFQAGDLNVAFDYFRVADGRLAEMWEEADRLGMLQQLGVVPA